jgi:hypothetical protein
MPLHAYLLTIGIPLIAFAAIILYGRRVKRDLEQPRRKPPST